MWTETTVVPGLNDDVASLEDVADFVASLRPVRAFVTFAAPVPSPTDWPVGRADAVARVERLLSDRFGLFETTRSREGA
jgi:pyruvate-formate lyase-activating enzyme